MNGHDFVLKKRLGKEGSKVGNVITLAVEKHLQRQQESKQEELRRLAVETLDAQRSGNKTQTNIWRTLIATITISVLISILR